MITVNRILLSHAEMAEDVIEGFLGGDESACDFGEGIEGEAEVFGHEVGGGMRLQACEHSVEMVGGSKKGIIMTRG